MDNKEGYYLLWDELAKTGEQGKEGKVAAFYRIFSKSILIPLILNYCFACEEAILRCEESINKLTVCDKCPIYWGEGLCESSESPYTKWLNAETIEERKYWAAIIRDLPWKEKGKGMSIT